jgi:hypothetical protein
MPIVAGVGPANASNQSTSISITLAGCTAGRSVMILVSWRDLGSTDVSSVTCTGETVTSLTSKERDAPREQSFRWYRIESLASGGSKQVDVVMPTSVNVSATLYEFSGMAAGAADAVGTPATGSSGTQPTANVTTSTDNCAIFAVGSNEAGSLTPSTAGYVDWDHPGPWFFSDVAHNVGVGAAGSKSMSFNTASSAWWAFLLAMPEATGGAADESIARAAFPAAVATDDEVSTEARWVASQLRYPVAQMTAAATVVATGSRASTVNGMAPTQPPVESDVDVTWLVAPTAEDVGGGVVEAGAGRSVALGFAAADAASFEATSTRGVALGQAAAASADIEVGAGGALGRAQAAAFGEDANVGSTVPGPGAAIGRGQATAVGLTLEAPAAAALGRGQAAAPAADIEAAAGGAVARAQDSVASVTIQAGTSGALGRGQAAAGGAEFEVGGGSALARAQAAATGEDAFGNLSVPGAGRALARGQAAAVGVVVEGVAAAAIGRAMASAAATTLEARAAAAAAIATARAPGFPLEAATGAAIGRAQAQAAATLSQVGAGAALARAVAASAGAAPPALASSGRRGGTSEQFQDDRRGNVQTLVRANVQRHTRKN